MKRVLLIKEFIPKYDQEFYQKIGNEKYEFFVTKEENAESKCSFSSAGLKKLYANILENIDVEIRAGVSLKNLFLKKILK